MVCLTVIGLAWASLRADEEGKLEPTKLVGTWTYASAEQDGKKKSAEDFAQSSVEITTEKITLKNPDGQYVIKYKLDTSKTPCRIEMEITEGPQGQGARSEGIIALKGNELKLCYAPMGGDTPPKDFSAKEGSGLHSFVLKRKK
jgi:uncharacterized protein (TIGR03067 family)